MNRPLAAGLLLLAACGGPAPGAPVEQLTIPPGSTLQAVADTLVAHGVIAHPTWFRLLARARRSDRRLQAGIYEFLRGERSWDVIDVLVEGRGKLVRFTLPEGLTVREAAAVAERELAIPADSFLAAALDTALVHGAGLDAPSLEGFLYPETYLVPPTVTASGLAGILGRAAAAAWTPARDARLDSLGMTRLEAVTLASIVEGEARAEEERAVIAAVYHNRLKLGMALQADPTVAYGIELKTGSAQVPALSARLSIPLAVQHVSPSRPAARTDQQSGSRQPRGRALPGDRTVSLFRRRPRWAARLQPNLPRAPARDSGAPHTGSAGEEPELAIRGRRTEDY